PEMTCVVAVVPALLSTPPGGLDVTVNPVIELPPLYMGAVKVTVALALPAVAVTPVGAPGTVNVGLAVKTMALTLALSTTEMKLMFSTPLVTLTGIETSYAAL